MPTQQIKKKSSPNKCSTDINFKTNIINNFQCPKEKKREETFSRCNRTNENIILGHFSIEKKVL